MKKATILLLTFVVLALPAAATKDYLATHFMDPPAGSSKYFSAHLGTLELKASWRRLTWPPVWRKSAQSDRRHSAAAPAGVGAAEQAAGMTGRVSFVTVAVEPDADVDTVAASLEEHFETVHAWPRSSFVESNVAEVLAGRLGEPPIGAGRA